MVVISKNNLPKVEDVAKIYTRAGTAKSILKYPKIIGMTTETLHVTKILN